MASKKELLAEIDRLKREKRGLEDLVANHEYKIEHMTKLNDSTPSDCKRGEWCAACALSRVVYIRCRYSGDLEPIYLCGKGEACANFVEKKPEERPV